MCVPKFDIYQGTVLRATQVSSDVRTEIRLAQRNILSMGQSVRLKKIIQAWPYLKKKTGDFSKWKISRTLHSTCFCRYQKNLNLNYKNILNRHGHLDERTLKGIKT